MNTRKHLCRQYKSADSTSAPHSFTFKYDWDNDENCNISDEILSEKTDTQESKIQSMCNISTHSSPFKIKSPIENFKNKSVEEAIIRSERKPASTTKYNITVCDNKASVLEDVKSTQNDSFQQSLSKSLNMRDSIKGMLKQLAFKRKKQAELEESMNKNQERLFITMGDICCENE